MEGGIRGTSPGPYHRSLGPARPILGQNPPLLPSESLRTALRVPVCSIRWPSSTPISTASPWRHSKRASALDSGPEVEGHLRSRTGRRN